MKRSMQLEILFRMIGLKIKTFFNKRSKLSPRYQTRTINSKYLENNTMGCPTKRELRIYLPPGYFKSDEKSYPVIYLLHGYNSGPGSWTFTSRKEIHISGAKMLSLAPRSIRKRVQFKRFSLFYEDFDKLIKKGEIPPFLLVQPDASIGILDAKGRPSLKSSLYVKSDKAGDFPSYILEEIIPFVDTNYRTIPKREARAVVGGSLGGYGVLNLSILDPSKFKVIAASCPTEFDSSMRDMEFVSPIQAALEGQEAAVKGGKNALKGTINHTDMILGSDWTEHMLRTKVEKYPERLKDSAIFLSCEVDDEYGIELTTRKLHDVMEAQGIPHEFVVGNDPRNFISPHTLGSFSQILNALKFCMAHLVKK
ncbi:MAG: alpha/beta hydrolase [Candidatus Hodarchaeota archaeon]